MSAVATVVILAGVVVSEPFISLILLLVLIKLLYHTGMLLTLLVIAYAYKYDVACILEE